jgi:polyvinyl alcohol dehydrogenase (cytochrome)
MSVLVVALIALVGASVTPAATAGTAADTPAGQGGWSFGDWPMGGGNFQNTRSNPFETTISPDNVAKLAVKWTFTTHGDVSATAAVVNGAAYIPDWGGYFSKVDAASGALIWQKQISDYTGIAGDTARTSPSVSNGVVYIVDRVGAHLLAISAATGALVWSEQLDSHPAATGTGSPIVFNGVVYEGVSSGEEGLTLNPNYKCCTFRGSLTATDAATGKQLWKTYTIPDNGGTTGGYSGGSVWGGTPAIDPISGTVYVSTGMNYSVPQSVVDCENAGGTAAQCLDPNDHIDSIIAMDMHTGAIKWASGAGIFDTWTLACILGNAPNNCPQDPGKDYDFGDGPHLFFVPGANGIPREVVGGGSKSGTFWEFDAHTGQMLWNSSPGPGSAFGGIMWGSAVDFHSVYVAEANYFHQPITLPDGTTTTQATWSALDPATGKVKWETPDPSGGAAWSPLTEANGVLYASSTSGSYFAIKAATGQILWSFQGPYSVNNGPAVVDGTVYWGNGYSNLANGNKTTGTFYAFSVPGA